MSVHDDDGYARRLVRLTADTDCLRALVLLNDRPASTDEIAAALGIAPGAAAGHVERLLDEGLIEAVEERTRQGEPASRYRAVGPTLWTDDEWEAISVAERAQMTRWTIGWIASEVNHAVDTGSFTRRADTHVSRTASHVDERGWEELRSIFGDSLEAILRVKAESAERLADRGEEGFPVLAAMICCELPADRVAGPEKAPKDYG